MFYAFDAQIFIVTEDPKHSVDSVNFPRASISDVFALKKTKNRVKTEASNLGVIIDKTL